MYNRQKFNRVSLGVVVKREKDKRLHRDDLPRGWFTFNFETGEARPCVSAAHAIACCCAIKKKAGYFVSHPIYYDDRGWFDIDILSKEELMGHDTQPIALV